MEVKICMDYMPVKKEQKNYYKKKKLDVYNSKILDKSEANLIFQNKPPLYQEIMQRMSNTIQRQTFPKRLGYNEVFNKVKSISVKLPRETTEIITNIITKNIFTKELLDDELLDDSSIKSEDRKVFYIENDQRDEELDTYISQIVDTCLVFRELMYITFVPNDFRIDGDNIKKKADETVVDTVDNFVRVNSQPIRITTKNYSYFNPDICTEYKDAIVSAIKRNSLYCSGSYMQAQFTIGDDGFEEISPDKTYFVCRTMPKAEYDRLKAYFTIKDEVENQIEQITDILRFVESNDNTAQKGELKRIFNLNNLLSGHLGDFKQALTYSGIFVKFKLKRNKAGLLVHDYTSDENARGGGQGSGRGKIGVKAEQRGAFSFNLDTSLWKSVLFLSTVESYEVFDLRKKEGEQTKKGQLPFNKDAYKVPLL